MAGKDLDRLLWAVGEAHRLRRAADRRDHGVDPSGPSRYAEPEDGPAPIAPPR